MMVSATRKPAPTRMARIRGAINGHPRVVIAAGLATIALDVAVLTAAFGS